MEKKAEKMLVLVCIQASLVAAFVFFVCNKHARANDQLVIFTPRGIIGNADTPMAVVQTNADPKAYLVISEPVAGIDGAPASLSIAYSWSDLKVGDPFIAKDDLFVVEKINYDSGFRAEEAQEANDARLGVRAPNVGDQPHDYIAASRISKAISGYSSSFVMVEGLTDALVISFFDNDSVRHEIHCTLLSLQNSRFSAQVASVACSPGHDKASIEKTMNFSIKIGEIITLPSLIRLKLIKIIPKNRSHQNWAVFIPDVESNRVGSSH